MANPQRAASRRKLRHRRSARRIILTGGVAALAAMLIVLVPVATARDPLTVCVNTPAPLAETGVEGWHGEQIVNAATIMQTATAYGFGRDGAVLGVMTAMGESSLHNIDYGDWETSGVRNPDGTSTSSIGLFQQQAWWGSAAERMDAATAAGLFYARLARLAGWQEMEPTMAIHRVQINTDPHHYARFEADATAIVDALSGPCTG